MPSHHHRASSLRQSNKKNKRTKSSKRSLERKNNGRVALKSTKSPSSSLSNAARLSKEARVNRAKQLRSNKKDELLSRRRGILGSSSRGGGLNPPMIVGVLSLSKNKDTSEAEMIKTLTSYGEMTEVTGASPANGGICRFANVNKLCCRFYSHSRTIVGRSSENDASLPCAVTSALSLSLVCHSLVLLVDDAGTDDRGDYITPLGEAMLTALKAQGLPGTVHVVARSTSSGEGKKKKGLGAKYLQRMMTAEFGDNLKLFEYEHNNADDMMQCDNKNTVKRDRANDVRLSLLLRSLSLPQSPPKCLSRLPRSYLASEGGCSYDKDKERLVLTGYVRNAPLDVTALLHVMDVGSFRAEMVERVTDGRVWTNDEGDQVNSSDAEVCFANPDALEGEQNLIGFDENDDDLDSTKSSSSLKSTTTPNPPAVMDHASAWLNELDPDNNDALSSSRALSDAFNKKSEADSTIMDDMDEDADDDKEEERREKALREEQTFPDEVELRRDELGRDRYARYRSLKSFRKSFWDPMENLPEDYGKMFHFENFRGTRRDVIAVAEEVRKRMDDMTEENEGLDRDQMEEEDDEDDDNFKRLKKDYVPQNTLVRITLKIPPHRLQNHPIITSPPQTHSSDSPPFLLSLVSLLPHENKASVLHVNLSPLSDAPIVKSKDVLTFRIGGFRSFRAKPIFSQSNLNCDKHKFEKFLPPHSHSFLTASLYGPVTFSPVCPVLVFSSDDKLIATGTLSNVDARRIIIKRSILTGYPTRVRKRYATVKYMFYNPEDVKWFRPAGLSTKHGCKGHILESVGDHGTMKCLFDRPVQQHDTVCLPLYKRVFPKFVEGDGEKGIMVW